jgi:DNA-binding response OmpR family regulator
MIRSTSLPVAGAAKLLLIDDDRQILWSLERLLSEQGFCCVAAGSASAAAREIEQSEFDLVLLDLGLPDLDGLVLLRRIRATSNVPVVVVTARDGTADKVIGLEVGADDYIVKPFDPPEFLARIRAQLRRCHEYSTPRVPSRELRIGELLIELDAHVVYMDGRKIDLTPKEYAVLLTLAQHSHRPLSADWIYEHVWGFGADVAGNTPAVYLRRLRRKIEHDPNCPEYLRTVRGFGYRLIGPSS